MTIFDRYDDLVRLATAIAGPDGLELAHDTLMKVSGYDDQHQARIMANFDGYFRTAMWRSYHGKTGSFNLKFRQVRTVERNQSEGLDDSVILRELLDQQYRSLPKIERLIFEARFGTGQSTREVARCAGWDIRATRKRIQQIKEKIKYGIHKECLSC